MTADFLEVTLVFIRNLRSLTNLLLWKTLDPHTSYNEIHYLENVN